MRVIKDHLWATNRPRKGQWAAWMGGGSISNADLFNGERDGEADWLCISATDQQFRAFSKLTPSQNTAKQNRVRSVGHQSLPFRHSPSSLSSPSPVQRLPFLPFIPFLPPYTPPYLPLLPSRSTPPPTIPTYSCYFALSFTSLYDRSVMIFFSDIVEKKTMKL